MDDLTATYRELFNLQKAKFFRIDHVDTMIAIAYRVILPDQEPMILKVCTSEEDYFRELYFLKLLSNTLPVPRIVQVSDPEKEVKGAILMECIPGKLLQPSNWNESLSWEVGSTLARLHLNATKGYGDLIKPQNLTLDPVIYFGEKFKEELAECSHHLPNTLIKQCHRYFDSIQNLLSSVDGPCAVHRDFRPGNMIVQGGKLKGVIDWAGARSGFAEQDFCPMEHRRWPNNPAHKDSLLAGYASVRPVPDYRSIMPLLQLGRAIAVIGFTVKSNTWNGDNSEIYQYNRQFLDTFKFSN